MEERESAEQRSDHAHKRLQEIFNIIATSLKMEEEINTHDGLSKLSAKLTQIVQVSLAFFSEIGSEQDTKVLISFCQHKICINNHHINAILSCFRFIKLDFHSI